MKSKEEIDADRCRRRLERKHNKEQGKSRKDPLIDAIFKARRDRGFGPIDRNELRNHVE